MSRHSSLNELRNLVQLLNPKDLYPCVEDPQKLTYLDLEGCFGDVCDLSHCTYLKNSAKTKTEENGEEVLQLMLAERWGDDDISDGGVDTDDSSVVESDDSTQNSVAGVERSDIRQSEQVANCYKEGNGATEDQTDDEQEPNEVGWFPQLDDAIVALSQESTTVLCRDSHPANSDMIQYFSEYARDGGNIRLTSVDGMMYDEFL